MYAVPTIALLSLAALFGLIGSVQLVGPRFLRNVYERWEYPQHLRVATGLLDIAAAVMLSEPELRGWGLTLAAVLIFGTVVTLLNHRQYICAALVCVMMTMLVPASLAFPKASSVQFVTLTVQHLAEAD